MTTNLISFINDFKTSCVYNYLLTDPNTDIIMLWITGSTLTGIYDSDSDYDICVLCTKKPKDDPTVFPTMRLYERPGSYFLKYKSENKKVQWIYNDLADITTVSASTPLDNIGWAQFKNITTDFIIYKNPKYVAFIDYLISIKEQLFKNSAYLFVEAMLRQLNSSTLLDLIPYQSNKPNKGLSHAGWLAETLQSRQIQVDRLLRIKRNSVNNLSKDDLKYLVKCLEFLMVYAEQFDPSALKQCNLEEALRGSMTGALYEYN